MSILNTGASTTVQLGLCVGGLLRTWAADGTTQLWQVENDAILTAVQNTGMLARAPREDGRFREAAELTEGTSGPELRLPNGTALRLTAATGAVSPRAEAPQEFVRAVNQAVRHAAESFEFLVVEIGGWDAPLVPYAFFALHVAEDGTQLSTVEVSPPPSGSELWSTHLTPGEEVVSLSAPVSAEAIDMAPYYLADAVPGWGILPWDIALTFGVREQA
ncbi:hypothetical protein [Nocardioides sp. Kera G14]|uniref:hypothetical protein n=1 Tax=Nocardioides sp. Kera G14 TaxID=2884264 RepID=UPI001D0F9AF9|nr:hypothetical protein [Nocardioides sp. Kera G14]UDY24664.1 hypothetical protein LH076_04985 [Nocardioides sp. Kera G14]